PQISERDTGRARRNVRAGAHCNQGVSFLPVCQSDRQIKTTSSNPSHIYVEEMPEDPACSSQNANQLAVPIGQCGMTAEKTVPRLFLLIYARRTTRTASSSACASPCSCTPYS